MNQKSVTQNKQWNFIQDQHEFNIFSRFRLLTAKALIRHNKNKTQRKRITDTSIYKNLLFNANYPKIIYFR